jgi:hypothetical protein
MDTANQYDGPCWRCGTTVRALTGTYNRERRQSEHPEGACKTTTKTWRHTESVRRMEEYRAVAAALWADAGYERQHSSRVEHPDVITGHGLRVLIGGDKPGDVFGHGVRIYRGKQLLGEYPRPVAADPEGSRYFEAHLDMTRALIALIDAHKAA